MDYYKQVLQKYVTFSGRARRKEFWMFFLWNLIITIVLSIVDNMLGLSFQSGNLGILSGLYSLGVFLPNLAVTVRRLHDVGKSGWMLLIGIIPLIGWIWLLVLYCRDSQSGMNKYGANPKGDN